MVLYGSTIPESKRFFKISELAGKRWPNVTEDEIYNWHDVGHKSPIAAEGLPPLVDTTCPNMWNEEPHWGEINLMAYWVFFPEFYSLAGTTTADIITKHFDDETVAFMKRYGAKLLKALNSQLLSNHFFMIGTDSAKGFAYNNRGSIDCIDFYDEQGFYCPHGVFDGKAGKFLLTSTIVNKEDLLIKASSVQFLEQIVPELTNNDRGSKVDVRLNKSAESRAEKTDLKIIGALVSIVREQTDLKSQAQIIDHIINQDQFKRIPGLSSRTMQDRFSQANTALKDAGD